MNILKVSLITTFVFCIGTIGNAFIVEEAGAKGFRSSSFSRSTFRSSSFKSVNRSGFWSSKSSKKAVVQKTSSFKSTSTKTIKTKTRNKSFTKGSSSKKTKAIVAAKKQRRKFKKPVNIPGVKNNKHVSRNTIASKYSNKYESNAVYNKAKKYDSSTYWSRRNSYYRDYQPPTYVYNMAPSYGLWDTIFLYSLFNNMNNAGTFAYHHQNDPDYIKWREEAEQLAKNNADLRKQLNEMDAQANKLKGQPINPDYLPKGVDADIALSQEARFSQAPTFRMCVGSTSGAYNLISAGIFAPNTDFVNIVTVNTKGSGQALEYLASDKCDGAFVQGDSYWNYIETHKTTNLPFERMFSPYREVVHLICNEDGPSKISKLGKNNRVWFPKGSGAEQTWMNFIGEDEDYKKIPTVVTDPGMTIDSNEEALMKVAANKNDCMMYVAAPGATEFMRKTDKVSKTMGVVLIDINDGSLDNTTDPSGSDVYDFTQIDESVYKNLTRQAGVVYGGGDIDTLSMNTDILISTKWKEKHKDIYPNLVLHLMSFKDRINNLIKQ